MKLSINLVQGGKYVRAGDELPADFILPEHLERFAVYDDEPSQISQAIASHFSHAGNIKGVGSEPVKLGMDYREGEEEFVPKWPRAKKNAPPNKKTKGH